MLALETGWTPDVIATLSARFRAACHWWLYVRTLLPEGFPEMPSLNGMSPMQKADVAKQRIQLAKLRTVVFPADE
jgi:hypothetical protein